MRKTYIIGYKTDIENNRAFRRFAQLAVAEDPLCVLRGQLVEEIGESGDYAEPFLLRKQTADDDMWIKAFTKAPSDLVQRSFMSHYIESWFYTMLATVWIFLLIDLIILPFRMLSGSIMIRRSYDDIITTAYWAAIYERTNDRAKANADCAKWLS